MIDLPLSIMPQSNTVGILHRRLQADDAPDDTCIKIVKIVVLIYRCHGRSFLPVGVKKGSRFQIEIAALWVMCSVVRVGAAIYSINWNLTLHQTEIFKCS